MEYLSLAGIKILKKLEKEIYGTVLKSLKILKKQNVSLDIFLVKR